jgi:mannose-6-phosphate isomerase-like protein (cupin superfamily)
MSKIFYENIEANTLQNEAYRKVVYTGKSMQFVYMSLQPLDDIHMEIHQDHEQFIRIESGEGKAIIDSIEYKLFDGIGFIIPQGIKHQIINTSSTNKLKLYTIYSPPEHPPNRIQLNNPDKINNRNEKLNEINNEKLNENEKLNKKYLKYKSKYLSLKNINNN